jgi:aminomethyltransferase
MPEAAAPPKKTPLHEAVRRSGARLVEFAGWELPVRFTSVLEEHQAVRTAAGLFDVSHMGEIDIRGGAALRLVQSLIPGDAAALRPGRALYSALTTERGTFVDDILVYRRAPEDFLLVVNAANTEKDFAWVARHAAGDVEVVDVSARHAQLALQGPRAAAILRDLVAAPLEGMRPFDFVETTAGGARALVSRTGYTGEDGFEIYLPPAAAADLWDGILRAGRGRGLLPCGLGARDTLRLEARLLLYGRDIDDTTTVLEAGLTRIVRFDKGEFLGRAALLAQRAAGPSRRLVGFEMRDPGIPRHGYAVRAGDTPCGTVTSGGFAPFLKKSIGLAYVPADRSGDGTPITVDIRGRPARAVVVPTPFYRRAR